MFIILFIGSLHKYILNAIIQDAISGAIANFIIGILILNILLNLLLFIITGIKNANKLAKTAPNILISLIPTNT